MLKKLPGIGRFHHTHNLYKAQAIVGENGGNDEWRVNVRIWKQPHEKTWRYSYGCEGNLCTASGIAYEPHCGEGEGYASVADAYTDLEKALSADYA